MLSGCILDELRRVLQDRHGLSAHEIDDLIDALAVSRPCWRCATAIRPAEFWTAHGYV